MLEHDDDDRYITQAVFDEQHLNVAVEFVSSANEFFLHLDRCDGNKETLPALILLNYHAKPNTAVEVLKKLKEHPTYKRIPAVVLSGSVKPEIVQECYENGASSFIQKPWNAGETEETIKKFFNYWFQTVVLP